MTSPCAPKTTNCSRRDEDLAASLKYWGGFLIHDPEINPTVLSVRLCSQSEGVFFNRCSIGFLIEILRSKSEILHSVYSKSHYLAADRFLVRRKKKKINIFLMNKRFPRGCLGEIHPPNLQCQHFAVRKNKINQKSAPKAGKSLGWKGRRSAGTPLPTKGAKRCSPMLLPTWTKAGRNTPLASPGASANSKKPLSSFQSPKSPSG